MKTLQQHISEKLVINKNYNNSEDIFEELFTFFEFNKLKGDDSNSAKKIMIDYFEKEDILKKINYDLENINFYTYPNSHAVDIIKRNFNHEVKLNPFVAGGALDCSNPKNLFRCWTDLYDVAMIEISAKGIYVLYEERKSDYDLWIWINTNILK